MIKKSVLIFCCFLSALLICFIIFGKIYELTAIKKIKNLPENPSLFSKPIKNNPSPNISSLSLDNIFSLNHNLNLSLAENQTITIITTGDVMPARTVNYKMINYNDFTYPFIKTADFLKTSDLTLINLEAPLVQNCPTTNEGMIFCGRPDFVNGLLLADIDVVNLANNHSLNWGLEGINQTINLLNQNQIINCGFPINKPGFASIKNTKIAFLGWNLLEEFNQEEILNTIKQVKKQSNLIIVSLHWGTEYTSFPEAWQINLAHQIINAGADLIAGNHPHWIQSIEIYQQKLIIYSHGNFIFDQEWSQQTKTGILAKHTFYQNQLIDSQLFPVFIKDYSQPEILEEKEKQQILEEIKTNSFKLLNLYQ